MDREIRGTDFFQMKVIIMGKAHYDVGSKKKLKKMQICLVI